MTWKCYPTIFKAESPVHIGYRQIGILKTTRYYITGRAIWGAITANLTRALFSNPDSKDYQAVGNFVKENIRTTYFYPAIRKDDADSEDLSKYEVDGYFAFLPEYTDRGIKFGNESKDWFEQTFVDSFVSTALEPQTKTAEEGSLHEIEYIRNKIKLGKVVQVYYVGYLFVNFGGSETRSNGNEKEYEVNVNYVGKVGEDDIEITFNPKNNHNSPQDYRALLKEDVLSKLFVGGERNYGFGRLRLCELKPTSGKLFNQFEFKLSDQPILSIDNAIAHVEIHSNLPDFLGEFEPLVGLEWSEAGAGHRISSAVICAVPGSRVPAGEYVLKEYGILTPNLQSQITKGRTY
jgi:hypothetical protein